MFRCSTFLFLHLLLLQVLLNGHCHCALIGTAEPPPFISDEALIKRDVGTPKCGRDYGRPLYTSCAQALATVPENAMARPDIRTFSGSANSPYYTVLPQSWAFDNCIISLNIGENQLDQASWNDVRIAAMAVMNSCLRDPPDKFGGRQFIGQRGKLGVSVSAPRSTFEAELASGAEARVISCQEGTTLIQPGRTICSNLPTWAQKGCRTKYCQTQTPCCDGYDCVPQDQPGLMEILFGAAFSTGLGGCMAPITS